MRKQELPQIIKDVGFDFSWSEEKVWKLTIPVEEMSIKELTWHIDIPFWSKPGGFYDLTPHEVLLNPEKYSSEFYRIQKADLAYPMDIMLWKNRWVLLDGLHRLAKAVTHGNKHVSIRKIPTDCIPQITE